MPGMTTECAGRRCPAGGAGGRAEEPLPAVRLHRGVRRVLADLLSCRQAYSTLERRLLREALRP